MSDKCKALDVETMICNSLNFQLVTMTFNFLKNLMMKCGILHRIHIINVSYFHVSATGYNHLNVMLIGDRCIKQEIFC